MAKYKLHPNVAGFMDPVSRVLFTPGQLYDIKDPSLHVRSAIRSGRLIIQPAEVLVEEKPQPSEDDLKKLSVEELKTMANKLAPEEDKEYVSSLKKKADLIDFLLSI